ncbi:MAG: 3-isopropylmalate dehydratase small subunit [Sporomusaceae bacterium]|nr:3-isopropylmalate dehydratase small subunit [Sporomusaceae bacterium]
MSNMIRGKVHKFGDNINTDLISPAQYIGLADEIMIAHAMEGADPDFPKKVRAGDIMVAGKNFGSGSSRETAPMIIKGSGIAVVIAEFFARIFYRNAINIGLSVLTTNSVSEINDGDELEVDPIAGTIRNITTGKSYQCTKYPENIMKLVNDGGLINHLRKQLKSK